MDKKNYKYQPQFSVGNVGQYAYYHDEDESQFTLVDQSKAVKTSYQKKLRSIQNVSCVSNRTFFTIIWNGFLFYFDRKIQDALNISSIKSSKLPLIPDLQLTVNYKTKYKTSQLCFDTFMLNWFSILISKVFLKGKTKKC